MIAVLTAPLWGLEDASRTDPVSFRAQICGLAEQWRVSVARGYHPRRSGQIAILPSTPNYMATGAGGWSHSGPWGYLQEVPLVFYGPGIVGSRGARHDRVTLADVAPEFAAALGDGPGPLRIEWKSTPRLIVTIVWDGGGWNTLRLWPGEWPVLRGMRAKGVSFESAVVGSSPSVTPAVHTTLGTGVFPETHGITGVPVLDERGAVVDAFLEGESSRFVEVRTVAERWDEGNGNEALVAMVGYEPWHLGMIGRGAETPGGDRDDAVWLDVETNEWKTNPAHYRLPPSLAEAGGLEDDLRRLDAADGAIDGAWGSHAILDRADRVEETPAFIAYHARALLSMIQDEGYGRDRITDFVYTNFKQIDRVGHYFNMDSNEVRDSIRATDEQLQTIVDGLDRIVGAGRWVVVVTADHGQQPDAADIGAYAVDPNEVRRDIEREFGRVVQAVWPTEIFLDDAALARAGLEPDDVAAWLFDYRVADNAAPGTDLSVAPGERVFDLAVPAEMLPATRCEGSAASGAGA